MCSTKSSSCHQRKKCLRRSARLDPNHSMCTKRSKNKTIKTKTFGFGCYVFCQLFQQLQWMVQESKKPERAHLLIILRSSMIMISGLYFAQNTSVNFYVWVYLQLRFSLPCVGQNLEVTFVGHSWSLTYFGHLPSDIIVPRCSSWLRQTKKMKVQEETRERGMSQARGKKEMSSLHALSSYVRLQHKVTKWCIRVDVQDVQVYV